MSSMKNKFSAYSLPHSIWYAFRGIARSLWQERNLRIHFAAGGYLIYFSHYFSFSKAEYGLLIAIVGLVVACELINTAVEAAVDLKMPTYDSLAKTAKDAAAGAVLVSAAVSVAVGVLLFWQPEALKIIWADILKAPVVWLLLLAITGFLIAWPERHRDKWKNPRKK